MGVVRTSIHGRDEGASNVVSSRSSRSALNTRSANRYAFKAGRPGLSRHDGFETPTSAGIYPTRPLSYAVLLMVTERPKTLPAGVRYVARVVPLA